MWNDSRFLYWTYQVSFRWLWRRRSFLYRSARVRNMCQHKPKMIKDVNDNNMLLMLSSGRLTNIYHSLLSWLSIQVFRVLLRQILIQTYVLGIHIWISVLCYILQRLRWTHWSSQDFKNVHSLWEISWSSQCSCHSEWGAGFCRQLWSSECGSWVFVV